MPKYSIEADWAEIHGGEIIVEAKNKEEVYKYIRENKRDIFQQMEKKYDDTFGYVSGDIDTEVRELIEEETDIVLEEKNKDRTVVGCPDCLSSNVLNKFEGYKNESQEHIGFICKECNNHFNRKEAIFREE